MGSLAGRLLSKLALFTRATHNARPMKFTISTLRRDWHHLALLGTASLFPVALALLLTLFVPVDAVPAIQPVTVKSAHRLEALFDSVDYSWPPREIVPALGVTRIPADMAKLEVGRKKELFLRALLPLVLAENAQLRAERRWLEKVMANAGQNSKTVQNRLRRLADEYGLDGGEEPMELLPRLYRRIDVVPVGLVLAQAANESGWGTSRFSLEVNNLFGEWTYKARHGVLPQQRADGARHFVRSFGNLRASVRSYMHNINSGQAYAPLRELRARMRREGRELDPLLLAKGLVRYSARGEAYVAEIRAMIRSNGLNVLGPLRLAR